MLHRVIEVGYMLDPRQQPIADALRLSHRTPNLDVVRTYGPICGGTAWKGRIDMERQPDGQLYAWALKREAVIIQADQRHTDEQGQAVFVSFTAHVHGGAVYGEFKDEREARFNACILPGKDFKPVQRFELRKPKMVVAAPYIWLESVPQMQEEIVA